MKIIIDGNSIFYKLYFGMKDVEATNQVGVKTGAIYGFLRYLNSLKNQYNISTQDIYVTFDNTTSKEYRKQLFSDYKENRLKTDSDLFTQLNYLLQLLDFEGIKYFSLKGLEADDICFQLSLKFHGENTEFLVISRDHDLLLNLYVSENSKVLIDLGSGKNKLFTRESFITEYGFKYHHFLDYKTLCGDSSDNIKGIDGVGETGAKNLFIELDTLDLKLSSLLENLDGHKESLSKKSVKVIERVIEQIDKYNLFKKIMSPITGFGIPELENKQDFTKADTIYNYLEIEKNRFQRD